MVGTRSPRVRIVGGGRRLRLRTLGDWDGRPLDALRECRHAATALEKAIWQTVRKARATGHSWTEIGTALGITKQTAWQRFSREMRHPITGEEIDRKDGD
jgi:broad specificity phosphatase PhoE